MGLERSRGYDVDELKGTDAGRLIDVARAYLRRMS
jgi:hypothetical protein